MGSASGAILRSLPVVSICPMWWPIGTPPRDYILPRNLADKINHWTSASGPEVHLVSREISLPSDLFAKVKATFKAWDSKYIAIPPSEHEADEDPK